MVAPAHLHRSDPARPAGSAVRMSIPRLTPFRACPPRPPLREEQNKDMAKRVKSSAFEAVEALKKATKPMIPMRWNYPETGCKTGIRIKD